MKNNIDKEFYDILDIVNNSNVEDLFYTLKENLEVIKRTNIQSYEKLLSRYNFYKYWGGLKPEEDNYELIEQRINQLKFNNEKFIWMYENLEDYRSRKVLLSIIQNWITFDFEYLKKMYDFTYEHYFDLDIINCDKNEVFLDIGAYIGDTVQSYIRVFGEDNYKKIYCYEITEETFNKLKRNTSQYKNIEYRMKGVSNKIGHASLNTNGDKSSNKLLDDNNAEIVITTIDEDINEEVTFIKMDIEGAEKLALGGCKNHIKKSHPKLVISIYHNNEDIWKIAELIKEIDPTYKFYMRYYGGNLYPNEYILFAV